MEASIPVDLFNPGQAFACLGFLEAADTLVGDAEGGFDWSDEANIRFVLSAAGERNPFEAVLEFLAETNVERSAPLGYVDPPAKKNKEGGDDDEEEAEADAEETEEVESAEENDEGGDADQEQTHAAKPADVQYSEVFPGKRADKMTLPVRLGGGNRPVVELGHWADGSSCDDFKLYSGNRSAAVIVRAMLKGTRHKPSKKQKTAGLPGDLKTKGVAQLWDEGRQDLIAAPLGRLTPMGGSFNFDPRGAWTGIDAGYSPNTQKHQVEASPVVEILAAWGLEHARPAQREGGRVGYAAWACLLPPMLARIAFAGGVPSLPLRRYAFELVKSGKNSVVTFAELERDS